MPKEFIMRGKTPSDNQEVLEFGGYKDGYGYRLVSFELYPSTGMGGTTHELSGTITAAKTFEDPANPNFKHEGLIGTAVNVRDDGQRNFAVNSIVNDLFIITQNVILAVVDTHPGTPMDVNWQCRFVAVKMTGPEEAATNYKQYTIFDS